MDNASSSEKNDQTNAEFDIYHFVANLGSVVSNIWSRIQQPASQVIEAAKPLVVVHKLGESQFVYWEYLSSEFVDDVFKCGCSKDVNSVLENKFCGENSSAFIGFANCCFNHERMKKYNTILNQCLDAYRNGAKELAAMGLCAIIDGLLSDISGKINSVDYKKRIEMIMGQIEVKEATLDNTVISSLILVMTIYKTFDIYKESKNFSSGEPDSLNRNWIMHGRSMRKITELDFIKILRMLYGILLLDDLADKEV